MRVACILVLAAGLLAAPAVAQRESRMTLQPDRLPGMCVTMAGAAGSVSIPCDGSARQYFVMPGEAGGPIRQGGMCIAVRGDGYYPPLVAEACDGSPAQTWTMNAEREVRNGTGRCLSLMGQVSVTGTTVFGGACAKEGSAHQWKVTYVDFTNVVEASLESRARPGMCIGYDNTGVDLYPCSDNYGQVISFDVRAIGQLRLKGSCFSGGYAFGALSLGSCYDMPAQQWVVLDSGAVANALYQCIEVVPEERGDVLRTTACKGKPEQQWTVRMPPAK